MREQCQECGAMPGDVHGKRCSQGPLVKGEMIGPGLRYGGNMDTGEGDPFGLRGEVFNVLLQDTADQLRAQGQCAVITGDQVCLNKRPCPEHEPERHNARQVSLWERFARWLNGS